MTSHDEARAAGTLPEVELARKGLYALHLEAPALVVRDLTKLVEDAFAAIALSALSPSPAAQAGKHVVVPAERAQLVVEIDGLIDAYWNLAYPDGGDAAELSGRAQVVRSALSARLAMLAAAPPASELLERMEEPRVHVREMKLSDGRVDYYVAITVADREVTPHKFADRRKAEYEVATYRWLLLGEPKPEFRDFFDAPPSPAVPETKL